MDDTVKIIVGVALVVGVGLLVREFSGANEPEEIRACANALDALAHDARKEGTETCREIDSVREIAERGVSASSVENVVSGLRIYVERPPYGCRSLPRSHGDRGELLLREPRALSSLHDSGADRHERQGRVCLDTCAIDGCGSTFLLTFAR